MKSPGLLGEEREKAAVKAAAKLPEKEGHIEKIQRYISAN